VTRELVERLGFDRLPHEITTKSVSELMDLTGRVAFVTGGGGPGLGQAIVHRLASQGATVALADLDVEAAARVAGDASARWGVRTLPLECDVRSEPSVTASIDRCVAELGALDILVNDVGGYLVGSFETTSMDDAEALIRLNLVSQLQCTKAALAHMIPQRSGSIVNISSDGGKMGSPLIVVYNAIKAGLIGFTRNLAFDVSKYGIRVNCVCPGIMLLPVMEAGLAALEHDDPAVSVFEFALDRVPLGRGCLPEEVANVVAFLAGDAASYVQGAAYSVGGGLEL
jgi:3-oxoacyl-[acyl-carrier protein] reductase